MGGHGGERRHGDDVHGLSFSSVQVVVEASWTVEFGVVENS